MSAIKIKLLPLCLIFSLFVCSACNITRIDKKGYMFDSSGHETLQEGVTTKQRTLMLMGSPTTISDLGDEELWIYYHEDIKELLFFKPKIINRTIFILKFDDQQTIKYLRSYDLSSEQNLVFNKDFTKIQNREEGFFKKIFGNVGQVRPF